LRLNGRAVKGQVTAGLLTIGNYGGYTLVTAVWLIDIVNIH
jgi:hypothetical protein